MNLRPALELVVRAGPILFADIFLQLAVKEGVSLLVVLRHSALVKQTLRMRDDLLRFQIVQNPDII